MTRSSDVTAPASRKSSYERSLALFWSNALLFFPAPCPPGPGFRIVTDFEIRGLNRAK
jgi:hypothetical protein